MKSLKILLLTKELQCGIQNNVFPALPGTQSSPISPPPHMANLLRYHPLSNTILYGYQTHKLESESLKYQVFHQLINDLELFHITELVSSLLKGGYLASTMGIMISHKVSMWDA